jgi:hypothetical protein
MVKKNFKMLHLNKCTTNIQARAITNMAIAMFKKAMIMEIIT